MGLSQKRAITCDEFSERYNAALERSKDFPRTHESKHITNIGGKARSTVWKWVYTGPHNSNLKFEERSAQGVVSFEMITLAENTYCKVGDGEWKKTSGAACDVRVGPIASIKNPLEKLIVAS